MKPVQLTQEQARIILAFLQRADMKGNEAPTFMHVAEVLNRIANEPSQVEDTE